MKSKVLFWYDEGTVGVPYSWIDFYIRYFDLEPRVLDTLGHFPQAPRRLPIAYLTLNEAMEDLGDHTWIFMAPDGDVTLDEFQHPDTPCVYAFGSDVSGFGVDPHGLGLTVKLSKPVEEPYAFHMIPFVLYDRDIFLRGRRS